MAHAGRAVNPGRARPSRGRMAKFDRRRSPTAPGTGCAATLARPGTPSRAYSANLAGGAAAAQNPPRRPNRASSRRTRRRARLCLKATDHPDMVRCPSAARVAIGIALRALLSFARKDSAKTFTTPALDKHGRYSMHCRKASVCVIRIFVSAPLCVRSDLAHLVNTPARRSLDRRLQRAPCNQTTLQRHQLRPRRNSRNTHTSSFKA